MLAFSAPTASNPRPRNRPARYTLAVVIGVVVLLVVVGNALLDYVFIDSIPGRATLYGLVAVALIAVGTYIQARAFHRDPVTRRRHLIRAGVLLGLAAMLWLLISDLFLFAQAAGPGVAAVCALAGVATPAFELGGEGPPPRSGWGSCAASTATRKSPGGWWWSRRRGARWSPRAW